MSNKKRTRSLFELPNAEGHFAKAICARNRNVNGSHNNKILKCTHGDGKVKLGLPLTAYTVNRESRLCISFFEPVFSVFCRYLLFQNVPAIAGATDDLLKRIQIYGGIEE